MSVKWPEKKKTGNPDDFDMINEAWKEGWNAAIEACRKAYEQEPKLMLLDVKKVAKEMYELCCYPSPEPFDNIPEPDKRVWEYRAGIFCSRFAQPKVTVSVEEIEEIMIKEMNLKMPQWDFRDLAQAIFNRLNQ